MCSEHGSWWSTSTLVLGHFDPRTELTKNQSGCHFGPSTEVHIHFGPWSVRSLVISVPGPKCTSTLVLGQFGPWSVRSLFTSVPGPKCTSTLVLGQFGPRSHFGPLLSDFGPEVLCCHRHPAPQKGLRLYAIQNSAGWIFGPYLEICLY